MSAQSPAGAPVNYDQFVRKLTIPRPVSFILCTALLASVFVVAVRIRLFAVITYGRIIHEFDPWFNYRATEYMVEHGYAKFETEDAVDEWEVARDLARFFVSMEEKTQGLREYRRIVDQESSSGVTAASSVGGRRRGSNSTLAGSAPEAIEKILRTLEGLKKLALMAAQASVAVPP